MPVQPVAAPTPAPAEAPAAPAEPPCPCGCAKCGRLHSALRAGAGLLLRVLHDHTVDQSLRTFAPKFAVQLALAAGAGEGTVKLVQAVLRAAGV